MRKFRLFHVLIAFTIGFMALGFRLLWLQTAPAVGAAGGAQTVAMSVRQRQIHLMLDDGRGIMVDRSGHPLTGTEAEGLLLLPGGDEGLTNTDRARMAEALHITQEQLRNDWPSFGEAPKWWNRNGSGSGSESESEGEPTPLTLTQAETLRDIAPGAAGFLVTKRTVRYAEDRSAPHLVGFVAEQPERIQALYPERIETGALSLSTPIGAAGLELAFDRFLLGTGRKYIAYHVDGHGLPLPGLGVRLVEQDNPYYPLQAVTTVDADIQRSVEEAAEVVGLEEGAVVVLDAATADIVALVSKPSYTMEQLDPANWQNRAFVSVAPGSIAKTLIAAVALEEGVASPEETFLCDGSYHKYGMTCWKEGGHGKLTFQQALAESCNVVFAEVGERLSGETLQRYADALGMSGKVGWSGTSMVDHSAITQLPEEQSSRLFASDAADADGGVLAQTAIGQRDVRWTPLAAANWMVTLLHGGNAAYPKAVSELRYADGHVLERYAAHHRGDGSVLSPRTVRQLRRMMEEVVKTGTGASLADAEWPLAGKSGTAQAGVEGRESVHQWFVGYGPADRPRYAVAVVANNRPPESKHLAVDLFEEVMNRLARISTIPSDLP